MVVVELREGGVDLDREIPQRAQNDIVGLSTTMDARQHRNRSETAIQHFRLQNEADVTIIERSDLPQNVNE